MLKWVLAFFGLAFCVLLFNARTVFADPIQLAVERGVERPVLSLEMLNTVNCQFYCHSFAVTTPMYSFKLFYHLTRVW